MDVVLELTDTFIADYVYAWAHPARAAPYDYPNPTTNATDQAFSTWQYKPATAYFSVQPPQAAYMSAWPRDNIVRQSITLFFITWVFGLITYFGFATMSYFFVFDKKTKEHPKYLRNQIWLEIKQTNWAMPVMSLCTIPFFVAEVRGYGKMYDTAADAPFPWYNILQFPLFLVFTDFFIYWIHRGLHHPLIYKRLHKPHHKWIMPTPFASHAFHPLDGFAQSLPYHIFPFIFPLQKLSYVVLFMLVNFWTIMIHDGEFIANNPVVNGAACHSVHHLAFNYNYGQYTTVWDRLGGSYRKPAEEMFQKDAKMSQSTWKKQADEMEQIVKEVEGSDDRVYLPDEPKKTK
ncbi:C-5 sterol desaturase [Pleurostoma richardsiae]|uniref:C-5 sterol desaturase n=1 Tax=Pleurostoma richardsiae TaxID=41990 RepID=A0AA38R5J9_9PEZI|nr:C-5 sterol desaturase [Pleurostoma richardsiae]